MEATTAGQKILANGGAYNNDDAMIAIKRKRLLRKKTNLEKKKKKRFERAQQIRDGKKTNEKSEKEWNISDYKIMIKWKKKT